MSIVRVGLTMHGDLRPRILGALLYLAFNPLEKKGWHDRRYSKLV
jgi:hypothetical protein